MNQIELTGIVVCGGESSRMGKDKSMLQYYGEPQRYHVAQLLQPFCVDIYISLNSEQEEGSDKEYKVVRDEKLFNKLGPMTALLSAYHNYPEKNFLFIGCDYPLLTRKELALFVQSINETTKVKAFFNEREGFYEPLLAYYAAGFKDRVIRHFLKGSSSLQKLLVSAEAEKYFPVDNNTLISVDDQEQFGEIVAFLRK